MRRFLRISAIIIVCLPLIAPVSNAIGQTGKSSWDIAQLMTALAKVGGGTARFREERHISFLSEPLIAHGNLRFKSPDFLFKHTETPKDERLVVFGSEVTITNLQEGFQRTFSLEDYPQLRGLLDGIRYTLAGNLSGLSQSYETVLHGDRELWSLDLTPKLAPMLALVLSVKIFGRQNRIYKMEISESNGDLTVMFIEPQER